MSRFQVNPFVVEYQLFHTQLSPEQCQQRLRSRLVPWFWMSSRVEPADGRVRTLERPVAGSVSEEGFNIARTPWYLPFKTVASGQFVARPDDTRIAVRLSLGLISSLRDIGFLALQIWLVGGLIGWQTVTSSIALTAVMLLYPIGEYLYGRWAARGDGAALLAFLEETLDGEELPADRLPESTEGTGPVERP
jgi:hypothetical protein